MGHLSVEDATSAFLLRDNWQLAAFPGCGVWGTVDFDSKYKISRGEIRAHEEEKKFKTRTYIIVLKLPPPKISD